MQTSATESATGAGPAGSIIGVPLVTGGGGFAGRHLVSLLRDEGLEPLAPGRSELDLCDREAVREVVREARPAVVFHLAAFASPRRSWQDPAGAVLPNVAMTLAVLEAVRHEAPGAVLVLVTSGQVYGAPAELPVTEDTPLAPTNPYAVSKAACDMLGCQYAEGFGLHVVRLRPFNHVGPGQQDEYVLSSLTRQVAEAEAAGLPEALLRTGDVSSARDFTDVRDVVRAYRLAAELPAGAYNVCSGHAVRVSELIDAIAGHAHVAVRHEVDPALLRPADASEMRGSSDRLRAASGWEPRIPLADTVAAALDWWRARLAGA